MGENLTIISVLGQQSYLTEDRLLRIYSSISYVRSKMLLPLLWSLLWSVALAVGPVDMDATTHSPLDEARGITAVVNESTGEEVDVEVAKSWASIELFVIASLQLSLVLVSFRLDRARNPVLISVYVCAMFFGVLVRVWACSNGHHSWHRHGSSLTERCDVCSVWLGHALHFPHGACALHHIHSLVPREYSPRLH
jgi:hypothetical protein